MTPVGERFTPADVSAVLSAVLSAEVCTVLAQTDGTCAVWCASHGLPCARGQNNIGLGCSLDGSHAGGAGNGCYES